jgi:ATP-dependent Clp protease ATP-binding subunit ClpC
MFNYNFDENANDVINFAFSEARHLGHRYIGTEHILLGLSLVKGSKVDETFMYYRITAKDIRMALIKLIGENNDFDGIVDYTLRAKECLERSHQFAIKSNNSEIMPEHLFMSILADKQSIGYKVLSKLSLDMIKLSMDYEAQIKEDSMLIKASRTQGHDVKTIEFDEDYAVEEKKILNTIGTDLTELIKDQPDEATIGREEEIERVIQVLTRKTKNNPCLIGEPGVGKTAIVRGLARRIVTGAVPDALKGVKIFEINIGALVSGTMYRGQFEERMNELIVALTQSKQVLAFFDEIHNLIGVGATGEKSMDAFSMLKPYLNNGSIQIIGATTYQDFHKYIEPDQAVTRRLMMIPVEEPTVDETRHILLKIKSHYEGHHNVIITENAVKSAIDLSVRYILDRRLPDKAIDIIDEACSRKRSENLKTMEIVEEIKYRMGRLREEKEALILEMKFQEASKIQQEEKRILEHVEKNQNAKAIMQSQMLVVDQFDVEKVVSDWARVPITRLSTHDKARLSQIEQLLNERVYGQEQAIDLVSKSLKRFRMGIKDSGRPVGNFLFVGPTGVGKTELAKAIADIYFGSEKNLIKLDMSEYTEKHTVSKLIGSPPGYEGTREGGMLTNAISKMPYSVVVFDEIEKAHYEVINILLQIMDEGSLTDGRGKSYDFRNALIIMTSNLGADETLAKQVGFLKDNAVIERETQLREACKKYFKPEFINRIDEIIVFKALEAHALKEIVRLQMNALEALLESKQINLSYSDEVLEHIALSSYDVVYGARPIKRTIDKLVKDPIAELLLSESDEIGLIELTLQEGQIKLKGATHV